MLQNAIAQKIPGDERASRIPGCRSKKMRREQSGRSRRRIQVETAGYCGKMVAGSEVLLSSTEPQAKNAASGVSVQTSM